MSRSRTIKSILAFLCSSLILHSQEYNSEFEKRTQTVGSETQAFYESKVTAGTAMFYGDYLIDTIRRDTSVEIYLISNRHIFYRNEQYPDSIRFSVAGKLEGSEDRSWFPITLSQDYIKRNIIVGNNVDLDVAAIYIDSIIDHYNSDGALLDTLRPLNRYVMEYEAKSITPKIGDRVIILGYPQGFYDEINKYPVAKSGIIASSYGVNYNGDKQFLIDAKLYPSSSGSLVLWQPSRFDVIDKQVGMYEDKPFIPLGIYSGERFVIGDRIETDEQIVFEKRTMDFGYVWYLTTISDLIDQNKEE